MTKIPSNKQLRKELFKMLRSSMILDARHIIVNKRLTEKNLTVIVVTEYNQIKKFDVQSGKILAISGDVHIADLENMQRIIKEFYRMFDLGIKIEEPIY